MKYYNRKYPKLTFVVALHHFRLLYQFIFGFEIAIRMNEIEKKNVNMNKIILNIYIKPKKMYELNLKRNENEPTKN